MIQTLGKVVVKEEKWVRYPQTEKPQIPRREKQKNRFLGVPPRVPRVKWHRDH